MKCPECGTELVEKAARVKIGHPFGQSESVLAVKTRICRIFHCEQCNKNFRPVLKLEEVEVVQN